MQHRQRWFIHVLAKNDRAVLTISTNYVFLKTAYRCCWLTINNSDRKRPWTRHIFKQYLSRFDSNSFTCLPPMQIVLSKVWQSQNDNDHILCWLSHLLNQTFFSVSQMNLCRKNINLMRFRLDMGKETETHVIYLQSNWRGCSI